MNFFKLIFLFSIFNFCQSFGQSYKNDSMGLVKIKKPFLLEMKKLNDQSRKLYGLQKNADSPATLKNQKKIDSLEGLDSENYRNLILAELVYFQKKPGFKDAISAMNFSLTKQEAVDFYPMFLETFEKLDSKIKSSEDGTKFIKRFANLMNAQANKSSPQFILKDINNKIFNINDQKGKIILIDFWASWCEPCLKDLPVLKALARKYEKDGFQIVSISRDKNLESWKKSIIKNETENFIHISTEENKSDIEDLYVITGIPVKFLIDRNGVIIKKWRGGSDEILQDIQKELSKLLE